jgi:hypothetical protein
MPPSQTITETIISILAANGIPGIAIIGLSMWVKRLQDKVDTVTDGRLADAKQYTERALALQEAVHESVSKLSELLDAISQLPSRRP